MGDTNIALASILQALGINLRGIDVTDLIRDLPDFDIVKRIFNDPNIRLKITDVVTAWVEANIKNKTDLIFSLAQFETAWSAQLNKIFSADDYDDMWSKIFGLSELIESLGGEGTSLKDVFCSLMALFFNLFVGLWFHFYIEYDAENEEFVKASSDETFNFATEFTLELVIYHVVRKLRNVIVNTIEETVDLVNDLLPDQIELFIPVFSSAGIRIAHKVDNEWIFDLEEWPDTNDPDTYHLYFTLPDIFKIRIPKKDITTSNVYFRTEGTWAKSRKYTTYDLCMDFIGFGGILLVTTLIAKLCMRHTANNIFKNASPGGITSQLSNSAITYNNNVIFNKALAANMASLIAIINSLLGSAANISKLNEVLAALNFPEMPDMTLNEIMLDGITDSLNDVNADTDKFDITTFPAVVQLLNDIKNKIRNGFYQ